MKVPAILKISLGLVAFGAMLLLSPSVRAQSEVAPDHFDGTDSWSVALKRQSQVANKKAKASPVAKQAQLTHKRGDNNSPKAQPVALVTPQRKQTAPAKDQNKQ